MDYELLDPESNEFKMVVVLYDLVEDLKTCTDPAVKEMKLRFADDIAAIVTSCYMNYREKFFQSGGSPEQFVKIIRPVIDVLRRYMELKEGKTDAISIQGLPPDDLQDIIQGLTAEKETAVSYYDETPVIKELVNRSKAGKQGKTVATFGNYGNMTIRKGELGIFEYEVFSALAKCLREGRITKSGRCYIKIVDVNKELSGAGKDSMKPKRREDIISAFDKMGFRIEYATNEDLSDILGIDPDELDEEFADIKINYRNEQFLSYEILGGTQYGQPIELVVFKLADVVCKMIEAFPWYETVEYEDKRIQYIAETGELKDWTLTKERIELRTSIFRFVNGYTRARTMGKNFSNKKPYDDIFEECKIDTSHRQKRARRISDIAVIMDHLQRRGIISSWKEYTNTRSKKPDGIEIRVSKQRLTLTEGD